MEMMNQQLQSLLGALIRPAIEYNKQQIAFAGVSFFKNENSTISALLPAPDFTIEIEDVKVEPQGEYFNYITNTWGPCPYPIPIEEVMKRLKAPKFIGSVQFPFKNLINHLNKMDDKFKKRCRVIIAPDELLPEDMLAVFEKKNDRMMLKEKYNRLGKPCYVATDSLMPEQFVCENVPYKCVRSVGSSNAIYLNVVSPYSKVKLGIHYSEHGFFPDNMDLINRMVRIPPDFIMGTNLTNPQRGFKMPPIHLDCVALYDLVRVFGLIDAVFIEMLFGEDGNVPVVMRNIKVKPEDPQINILLGTLNTLYGAQRR